MSIRLVAGGLAGAALCFLASQALGHGDAEARLARLNERLARTPADCDLLTRRAWLHHETGHLDLALADLDRAKQIAPDRLLLDWMRSRVLLDAGRFAEAEVLLRGFLSHQPDHARAHAAHARALAGLQRYDEAARAFGRAIEHDGVANPELYLDQARMLVAADLGDPTRALGVLDEARQVFGPLPALEGEALELEVRARRFDAALLRVDRLAAGATRRESWLLRRAEILERAGRGEEAADAYQASLAEVAALGDQRRATPFVQLLEERARRGLARLRGAAR